MLTQLINNSGISICMVGTPESTKFFEKEMQLARRALGLQYEAFPYNQYFKEFCGIVYGYQYVKHKTVVSDVITEWLYEHSSGLASLVVSMIHDGQELAIMNGKEMLNLETLEMAYQERLKMMHGYIRPSIITNRATSSAKKNVSKKKIAVEESPVSEEKVNIYDLAASAKKTGEDMAGLLKKYVSVLEVTV